MPEHNSTPRASLREVITPQVEPVPESLSPTTLFSDEEKTARRAKTRLIRGKPWRVLAVILEVGIAFLVRELIAQTHPSFAPFITFYPAVLLASLLDGFWAGVAATVLTSLIARVWIFAPLGRSGTNESSDLLSLSIFFCFGIFLSILIEAYHRNREKLAVYLLQEAVSQERRRRDEERHVTELVRAERQRLFEVMDALPAMVSLSTTDHRIEFANRAFREKFGEPGTRRCFELRFGRTTPCADCQTEIRIDSGKPRRREISCIDGTAIELYDFLFKESDGTSLVLEMGLDITERRRAEAELKRYRHHLEELIGERTQQLEEANARLAAEVRQLEQAKQRLSESQAKLQAALFSMTDSMFITDTEGRFVEFNEAFATFYRFADKAECFRNFGEFTSLLDVFTASGEPLPKDEFPIARALRGETGSNVEYSYRRKDTGEEWIGSLSFSPARAEDGSITGAVITARDVTDSKRAERELAEARLQAERIASQLRTIFESVEERLYVCDGEGNPIMANNIARGGYSEPSHTPSVAEMQNSLELWNLEGRQLTLAEWPVQRVLRGEHVRSQEIRVRFKATGEDRILSCTGSAIRDQDGKILMAVFTSADITDRKRAEAVLRHSEKIATQREQFQALAESQRRAREEERTRVARDLHDQIGQILTAIKLDLTWMNRRLPRMSDEFRDRLNGAIGLLNDGVRSVRNICSGLRPGILDDVGLSAAIEWQANEFASRTGIACQASIPAVDIDLEGEQATEIFRIFQECLTNIIRHADAKTVAVSLSLQEETLLLTVKDDGKGFIESEASDSLGFLGMRERAQACGGHVEISSSPGKGTAVTLRVPIHSSELSDNEYAHSDR